uniref:Ammonium transporter n=1 Tax=Amphora coffeiformis TaxID=265554 RepID=A0A7S3LF15_9STRA
MLPRELRIGMNADMDVYGECAAQLGEEATTDDFLRCFSSQLSSPAFGVDPFSREVLLVFAAALVFLMQSGFAMVCAGAIRKKNMQNSMLKNLLDACGAAVSFFVVGYAFAFGGAASGSTETTFVGNTGFFLQGVDDYAFFSYNSAFAAATVTIVAGTLAERCQMTAYFGYSVLLAGWVWPIIVRAVWSNEGFLSAFHVDPLWGVGMVDFAGGGVVHVCGGLTALYAAIILGPRRGRFHDDEGLPLDEPKKIVGHSMALQMLGTFILWFGWIGFNVGPVLTAPGDILTRAGLVMVNTTLSGGIAGITGLFFNLWLLERRTGEPIFDLQYAMNGSLAGLVAITAGAGLVEPWAAFVIGFIAGILYTIGSYLLLYFKIDDAVDAVPVHLFNGVWGLIAVGCFAVPDHLEVFYGRSDHPGWFYSVREGDSNGRLMGVQLVGFLFIVGWVTFIMFPFFIFLNWAGWLRADPLDEIVGLDLSYHEGLALVQTHADNAGDVDDKHIQEYKERRASRANIKVNSAELMTGLASGEMDDEKSH